MTKNRDLAQYPEVITIGSDVLTVNPSFDSEGEIFHFTLTDAKTGKFFFETPYETAVLTEKDILGAFMDEGEYEWELRSKNYKHVKGDSMTKTMAVGAETFNLTQVAFDDIQHGDVILHHSTEGSDTHTEEVWYGAVTEIGAYGEVFGDSRRYSGKGRDGVWSPVSEMKRECETVLIAAAWHDDDSIGHSLWVVNG